MSLTQGLSDEEFQRMQGQLLELRTSNYQLKDQCKKYENELSSIKSSASEQARELEKATKAVSKSKKAKEVESLLNENDSLQRKLQSQEEDFRLQNSTLIEELSKLCTTNELLEKQLTSRSAGDSPDGGREASKQEDETRQLQAMNAALQKNLTSTQDQFQTEILDLQQKINSEIAKSHLTLSVKIVTEKEKKPLEHVAVINLSTVTSHKKTPTSKTNVPNCLERPPPTGQRGREHRGGGHSDTLEKEVHDILSYEWDSFIEDVRVASVTSDFEDDLDDTSSVPQDPVTVLQGHAKQLKTRLSGALLRNVGNLAKLVNKEEELSKEDGTDGTSKTSSSVISQSKEITELLLKVDTEREEKNLIKEQMKDTEQIYKNEIASLKDEIEKLTDKVKKKQESFVQLQNEKERQYSEHRQQVDQLEEDKNREIESLRREQNRLHGELNKIRENAPIVEGKYQQRIQALEELTSATSEETTSAERLTTLQAESTAIRTQNTKLTQDLSTAKQALAQHLEDLKKEKELTESLREVVEDREVAMTTAISERDHLQGQLKECLSANSKMSDQLREIQNDRNNLHRDLAEAHKIADNRKNMLDDLAIQTQTLREQHKEEMERLQETHQGEKEELSFQLNEEKKRRRQLEPLQDQITEMNNQIESLENAKGWFERSLREAEEQQGKIKEQQQEEISNINAAHEEECQTLRNEIEEQKEEVLKRESEVNEWQEKCQNLEESIIQMEVAAKDVKADQKLNDKKLTAKIKDLQRQMKQEKKRADKLQERLQEIITHGIPASGGLEQLLMDHTNEDRQKLDSSSISSLGTGTGTKDASDYSPLQERVNNSPGAKPNAVSLSEETTELISRLTEIQQQNWRLEEKVRHLEESNSCMAEDLLRKSAIIETHVMEGSLSGLKCISFSGGLSDLRKAALFYQPFLVKETHYPGRSSSPAAEKKSAAATSLNKLKEYISAPNSTDSDGMKDMNQKLQIMLEETLTKNMHLQQDIEMCPVRCGPVESSGRVKFRVQSVLSRQEVPVRGIQTTTVSSISLIGGRGTIVALSESIVFDQ
ncbi:putative GRIP1-associated protein 1 isoform X1 [Apostichopus japonicus]|uniref:Putative GRIP1-associated protein 1 isoform X1 n=1 Tax=Stichopus japonicus TaxID=307972 RepID=A0A2G8KZQ1_STIJA|nr:putative GRIP1-associated protein 1 isoform X1 [Apostichopus japonicus]